MSVRTAAPRTNKAALYRGGVPVTLWASSTINSGGSATGFDLGQLTLPYRRAMIVDSIRFTLQWTNVATVTVVPNNGGGSAIRCRFSVGHIGISNNWVPIWSYGPRLQQTLVFNNFNQPTDIETTYGLLGAYTVANAIPYSTFLWKPPVPIIVPPGACLVPSMQAGTDITFSGQTIEVAYAGRQMPESWRVPRQAEYPYVGASVLNPTSTAAFTPDVDLKNPFSVPIRVQRFTLRAHTLNGGFLTQVDDPVSASLIYMYTTSHRRLVDGQWPRVVFDRSRAAWTTSFELPPNEGVSFEVVDTGSNTKYDIAMIGSRLEQIQ